MKEQRHSILLPTLTTVILLSCASYEFIHKNSCHIVANMKHGSNWECICNSVKLNLCSLESVTVGSQPIITSNLRAVDKKHVASPMEKVILTCKTAQSTALAWSITPPLFDKSLIRYTPSDDPRSKNFTVGGFQSFLSEKIEIDQTHANLTSILTFVAREQYFNRTAITCADGKSNVTAMLFLSASNQAKIIYDFQYEGYSIAHLNQSVSLECSIADTLHLDWIIEPFITISNPIGFLPSNGVGMIVTQNHFTGNLTSLTPSLSDARRANMTSTLSFVANSSFNGSLHVIECHSDTSGVATILQIVEFSPGLTNFTCSMGTIGCGPPSTATVLCTWEVPAGGSRPLFFNIRLPNGTEDLIAGTQNSYSFVLSCEGGGPQEVYIFSNFNNDGVISASECRDVCVTGLSLSLAPVAAVVILPTTLIVLLVIITVLLMPHHFKVTNKECLKELAASNQSAQQPKLEEDNIELLDMGYDGKLLYRISWTVWWKSADQLVTIYQDRSDSKTTETIATTRCQYYDWSCQPGSQYKVSVRTKSACCMPFKRREKFFLTEVKLVLYPSGNVETVLYHFTPEDEGLVTCRYECGQDQRIKETYKCVQTNTQATVYERVVSNTSSTGTERLITIPFTRRNESGKYQIVLETLPIMGSTCVLNHPKVEVVFNVTVKVLPRIPQDLDYTDSKHHSVKLCWEQEYRSEDEEPSEYRVTVAEEAELCGPIVPTVSKIYPAKYMYTCEYTLRGLEPGKSYTVGITVNNMDGAVHSDEVTIVTTPPPPKPTIVRTTATTADFDCELRKKKRSELFTLVICSVTGEEVTRKQLKGKCGKENVSIDSLDPDTRYTGYLSASLEIDSELAVDGNSISFTTTVEDLSVEVYPEKPKLDDKLKFNIHYRVHLNNVEVFCTTPEKKRVEVKQISPPDDNNVVEAEIVIKGARNGPYRVTVASLLPDDANYDSRKSTASKSVDVECSAPEVILTVQEEAVTPISAKVDWMLGNGRRPLSGDIVNLSLVKLYLNHVDTIKAMTLTKSSGTCTFSNLIPNTTYYASLTVTYSGVTNPVTVRTDQFQTGDYKFEIKMFSATVQLKVDPQPPDGATLVIKKVNMLRSETRIPYRRPEPASSDNVINFVDLQPNTRHAIHLHINALDFHCGYFYTPKEKDKPKKTNPSLREHKDE